MSTTTNDILHYQRKLVKYSNDSKVLLHCLNRLSRLAIAVQHLQETGIGKTVNGMRKMEGQVGEEARELVNKWKAMVAAEDTKSDSENEKEEVRINEAESEKETESIKLGKEEPSKHKRPKKSRKDDESKREGNQSQESFQKRDRGKSLDDGLSSSKSKDLGKSSQTRSPSPPASKIKHKQSGEASSKESKKERSEPRSKSEVSTTSKKKRRHNSGDSSQGDRSEDEDMGGLSFAEALGSIGSHKKKKSKDKDREKTRDKHKSTEGSDKKNSSSQRSDPPISVPVPAPSRPPPSSIDIRSSDFEISPNYKPLPQRYAAPAFDYHVTSDRNQKKVSDEEALSAALALKGSRTKVFSGKASSGLTHVPRLFDFCVRVLQENIDSLEYTGGVPFDLLKPVLERATAQQLYSLENFNPYLLNDTDQLWKLLCDRECKKASKGNTETWRDVYLRCHEEREAKLKSLTANIQKSMAKATPVRTTKLAYVESVAKGPRGAARAQKNGSTAVLSSITKAKSSSRPFEASSLAASGGSGTTVAEVVKLPGSAAPRQSSSAPPAKKPKVAPLMQKTLKFIKNRYRR